MPIAPQNRCASGMRPTGPLHLGHYFGALKNWVVLQNEMETYFFIADLHALTSNFADTTSLRAFDHELVLDWLASGLDPEKAVLFQQSKMLEHSELALLLGMVTPVSWLERNPTYKEQQQEITDKDLTNYGFLGYPVLMAADILMYRPKWVPVGQDQAPHLEITREIARRFNSFYGDVFPEPEIKLTPAAKCPGLDGRKMSKSYGNSIYLRDSMDEIKPKIQTMFTDPARIRKQDPGNPDVCNLFPYHVLLSSKEEQERIIDGCTHATMGCVECKKIFLKNLQTFLEPLQEKRRTITTAMVDEILAEGGRKAHIEIEKTMALVHEAMKL